MDPTVQFVAIVLVLGAILLGSYLYEKQRTEMLKGVAVGVFKVQRRGVCRDARRQPGEDVEELEVFGGLRYRVSCQSA